MRKALLPSFIIMGFIYAFNLEAQKQITLTEEEKEKAIERFEAFQKDLNLSDEQKTKVEAINKKYFDGLSRLRTMNASRLEKYRTFKGLTNERDKGMKQVLDKNQYKLYQEFVQEAKESIRNRRKGGG